MLKKEDEREETQEMLKDIWWNYIKFNHPECSDEDAEKTFDYGVKFLDVIARLAIEEQMLGEKKHGGFSSFERNVFNSVSELLDAFYEEMLYRTWRKSRDEMGRVELEMTRDA